MKTLRVPSELPRVGNIAMWSSSKSANLYRSIEQALSAKVRPLPSCIAAANCLHIIMCSLKSFFRFPQSTATIRRRCRQNRVEPYPVMRRSQVPMPISSTCGFRSIVQDGFRPLAFIDRGAPHVKDAPWSSMAYGMRAGGRWIFKWRIPLRTDPKSCRRLTSSAGQPSGKPRF